MPMILAYVNASLKVKNCVDKWNGNITDNEEQKSQALSFFSYVFQCKKIDNIPELSCAKTQMTYVFLNLPVFHLLFLINFKRFFILNMKA